MLRFALLLAACTVLAGCAAGPQACASGQSPRVLDTLYFGANKPGGEVDAAQWRDFVDGFVTPRFPEGLSVLQAAGQWRNAQGVVERETSRLLQIVHEGSTVQEAAISDIQAHYKRLHAQEAVMRVRGSACVSF